MTSPDKPMTDEQKSRFKRNMRDTYRELNP